MIPEGSLFPVTFTPDHATEGIVVHLITKVSKVVIAKWAYPEREGYTLLTKTENVYTSVLEKEKTINKPNEELRIEIWEDISGTLKPIGIGDVVDENGDAVSIVDNTVKNS